MNEELIINADACYRQAEEKAADYFALLKALVSQKTYVAALTKDLQSWKHNHIRHHSFFSYFSFGKKGPKSQDYHNYIGWLNYTGGLDQYLDRSISYIFLRDMGKRLDSEKTRQRVRNVVDSLKSNLTDSNQTDKTDIFNMASLYRTAQKEQIESAMIWLVSKLKTVSENIPDGMNAEHAQRKLIKIIAGVYINELEEIRDNTSPEERVQRLNQAIRLGYAYGLTYPFIDDLLDAPILSAKEKKQYSDMIRTTLVTGNVSELGEWKGKSKELIRYAHSELREAFETIKNHQRPDLSKHFFEQAYVFFHSQELDREKELTNPHYSNEELYLPIILKSSSSRLIVRSVISASEDKDFISGTFFYGIYNQLADDFADMFDDMKDGAVTPYTYYIKYHHQRPDLINPFELYWAVISNLIHNVYESDSKTCEVILDRAINGLKRFKKRIGKEKYDEVMKLFSPGNPDFNRIIQNMVKKADDVDFFDKLLRDHMITMLKNERKEQEEFIDTVENVRNQVNQFLTIPKNENPLVLSNPIVDAANYSLIGDGKRLRPIMSWVMGVNGYGLSSHAIKPLLRSLEYMHTASLIFDDLPTQDNAAIRRGRSTLHQVYNSAIAELTGLFLTQRAIEEQTSLEEFDPKTVLQLIQYSARTTELMCQGQAMDLDSKGKKLTLEQLNTLCFYKTGIAFEASLIMPAILAQAKDSEIQALKSFARHAGIAFQIKDDLLDVEGNQDLLGKPIGMDAENNNSTFVTILGKEEAKKVMWNHYCLAIEALQEVPRNTAFLRQLMNYIVNRDH